MIGRVLHFHAETPWPRRDVRRARAASLAERLANLPPSPARATLAEQARGEAVRAAERDATAYAAPASAAARDAARAELDALRDSPAAHAAARAADLGDRGDS